MVSVGVVYDVIQSLPGMVGEYLDYLGCGIDAEKNAIRGEEVIISRPGDKVTVMVVPTNEELAIARQTVALV